MVTGLPTGSPSSFWRYLWPRPAALGLALGDLAPDFALWDVTHRRTVRLANWRGKQPLVLVFIRVFAEGVYCPFCHPHIMAMNQTYDRFRQAGAEVFLITSTSHRQSQAVVEDLKLTLPLLSDEMGQGFQSYYTGQALGAPLPAQFLLDVQGRLRYAHLFSFLHHSADPETLLAVLETL